MTYTRCFRLDELPLIPLGKEKIMTEIISCCLYEFFGERNTFLTSSIDSCLLFASKLTTTYFLMFLYILLLVHLVFMTARGILCIIMQSPLVMATVDMDGEALSLY